MNRYEHSKTLHERALKVLAGGVSSEFRKFASPTPLFFERGEGAYLWDVDGNRYLDFALSQGPLVLGHSRPEVLEAVTRYSSSGQLFAGQHEQELELAERLQQHIPGVELLRFSLSGSECDHAALRLARAATGRGRFIRFEGHYQGWFDNVATSISAPNVEALGPRELPCPVAWTSGLPSSAFEEALVLPWNDLELVERTLDRQGHEIAAIITEPVMCNNGCVPPAPGYLRGLRELCDHYGVVLIFDEVITGFRLGLGGAQAYFGVTPDLSVFGKAMASGYPIAFFGGKRRFTADDKPLMDLVADGTVIHAGTMNACNPCVAAALATVKLMEEELPFGRMFDLGQELIAGLRRAAKATGHTDLLVQGPGPMFHAGFTPLREVRDYRDCLTFDRVKLVRFVRGLQDRGVRVIGRGLFYLSAAHTPEDIRTGIQVAREVLMEMPA